MKDRYAIILVAGQGTRMKSKLKKELHPILGRPMIQYVLDALKPTSIKQTVSIVGHSREEVKQTIGDVSEYVTQEEQLGTGHAVIQAKELLQDKQGTTIVVCGDTPLITAETFEKLFNHHESSQSKATILTTKLENPAGYGRVVRNEQDGVEKIVEHKDASNIERNINEINTGTYCFDNEALFAALEEVGNDNVQGEYYVTDVIEILKKQNDKVSAYVVEDVDETIGINDKVALAEASKIMQRRINEQHLRNGVTILDPENTYISAEVSIKADAVIHPGSVISGNTIVGSETHIGPNSEIHNSVIGEAAHIRQSVVNDSKIGNKVKIGPYAHIRPEATIKDDVKVGNFVEIKNSEIAKGTKVPHLSYIGDASLGEEVNIGSGAVTVNYDGSNKHRTIIGDHAFIGCNANLIAPVTIENSGFVAAGSTITKDVPEESLAFGRAKQVNKEGYAKKLINKK